ncbi:PUA-like domain-containing protein [Dissophora ornata]|nr:PUA-like domain-containing protein [Dissophora ornata]
MATRSKRRVKEADVSKIQATDPPLIRAKRVKTSEKNETVEPVKTKAKGKSKSAAKNAGEDKVTEAASSEKPTPVAASEAVHLNPDGHRTSVWLMKSEPDTFSIEDLIKAKDSTSHWDGVRNHEAKNLMKNSMRVGDQVLFYHSNTKEPGIVALAKITREAYPDHTAFDPKSEYYDGKSSKDNPRWLMVDVKFDRMLKRVLTLKELQQYKDSDLSGMKLLNRGRLSVQPVSDAETSFILTLEKKKEP